MNNDYHLCFVSGSRKIRRGRFRISGPNALQAVRRLTALDIARIQPRYAYFTALHDLEGRQADKG